jgi:hypothetical protein
MVDEGWVRVTVWGASAMGHEPGDAQVMGGPLHYNGSVTWWQEGMSYVVTGDLPLEELLRNARSMK